MKKGRLTEFFAEPFREANELQRRHLEEHPGWDSEAAAILLITAFGLTVRHYLILGTDAFQMAAQLIPGGGSFLEWARLPANHEFARLATWTIGQTIAFLIVPLALNLALMQRPLSEYGCKTRGVLQNWQLYLLMYLTILPAIAILAPTNSFQHTYPFYRLSAGEPLWPRFIAWELLYAWQFIVLEFFFRGFLLHGLKRRFGFYSIFVMTVPYCMIHFGKPLPETLGSIGAGVILGFMSLKTRSIWLGAAVHIAVAWSMDLAALLAN